MQQSTQTTGLIDTLISLKIAIYMDPIFCIFSGDFDTSQYLASQLN